MNGERTFEPGEIRVDKLGGEYRLHFEDHEEPGKMWYHGLSQEQAYRLTLRLADLLAETDKPPAVDTSVALALHAARVRERELPALRERKSELLTAWVEKHRGGDAA